MTKWKKGFRKVPERILAMLKSIEGENFQISATKRISAEDVESGIYDHLLFPKHLISGDNKWELLPEPKNGNASKRNRDGWEVIRKDLPKYRKYYYRDIAVYGDSSRNGWATVAIPKDIYHRDSTPPYLFQIIVQLHERLADGSLNFSFTIDEVFSKSAMTSTEDVLFAVNLLQENTGVCGVVDADDPNHVFTNELNWELFPPGNIDQFIAELKKVTLKNAISEDTVTERLQLLEQFQPTQFLRGLGGNDLYFGAKFADDLVVFENLKYGNALYVLYQGWEELSQKPRSELLKMNTSQFDRIVHNKGWENIFAKLMQNELQQRGIRIRVGRSYRRR